ncbi:MAG: anhydro-N-acetylmuramic acid kinase [Candidatus Brockarchaeota archaeon]|nr:anhydro-N-acetylmuramic acid kinase [Candidatus Brockarchaeota archaeon]
MASQICRARYSFDGALALGELDEIASKERRTVIGLMSGTSADGITACAARLAGSYDRAGLEFIGMETYPYQKDLRARIFELFDPPTATIEKICSMNFELGIEFAKAATSLADRLSLPLGKVDLIGSHGQTVFHDPRSGGKKIGSTMQIGELAVIAEMTGVTTIGDFRKRDVAAGGEGAPLSAYVDYVLFRKEGEGIALQNIGGIANLSYLPPSCSEDEVVAFDTGPGNAVVDRLVSVFTDGRASFDAGGSIASKGKVDEELLRELLGDPFFSRRPPKSTGREAFGTGYAERFISMAKRRGLGKEDAVATATMLTVETIARGYEDFVFTAGPLDKIYLAGGGAKNSTMVDWLRRRLPNVKIEMFDSLGIPSEAREALYMAVLANEFVLGRASNLPSATGAGRKVILGTLVPGQVA